MAAITCKLQALRIIFTNKPRIVDDFLKYSLLSTSIVLARYFIVAGFFFSIFYVLFKKQTLIKKIQIKFPTLTDYKRDISYSMLSSLIFGIQFTITLVYLKPFSLMYDTIGDFGWPYFWLSMFLMVLLHDAYFYWTHRLIHHPRLFRHFHLVHHKATNPTPWTSLAFHPYEALLQGAIIPLIAFIIPAHKLALIIYFVFQLAHNAYGHLGFELIPAFIRKSAAGRFLNTSVYHNYHHKHFHGNYSLFFTFWDRWLGTMEEEELPKLKQNGLNVPEKTAVA
jgi:Delta7-sterol 5-desaturase